MSGRVDFFELMESAASKTRGKSVAQRLLAVAAAGHRMRLVLSAIWIASSHCWVRLERNPRTPRSRCYLTAYAREPQSRARDAYRHPYESLKFWV